jgi:myo-inositol-1(or 4)-monophosphatase
MALMCEAARIARDRANTHVSEGKIDRSLTFLWESDSLTPPEPCSSYSINTNRFAASNVGLRRRFPEQDGMSENFQNAAALTPAVREAAREAGQIANRFFRADEKTTARIWSKSGGSPVTEADVAVDAFLKIRLSSLLPEAAWLSEETADNPIRLENRLVWIVDPIDGTRAFLSGHRDWSVSIALLVDGRPALGIVYGPALDAFYEGRTGEGAFLNEAPIRVSSAPDLRGARVAGPQPMIDTLTRESGVMQLVPKIPSLALRIARIAAGDVDVGLVSSNARDWDIAAADLILQEAGGRLSDFSGAAPVYNRDDPVHGELLGSSHGLHPRLIEAMTTRKRHSRAI